MPAEIPPRTYRIVTTSGRVIDVVVTYQHDHWIGSVDGVPRGTGEDCRTAAIDACEDDHHVAEVRGPGELTTAEQLAEGRERFSTLASAARDHDRAVVAAWAAEETLDLFDDVPDDGTDERVEFDQAVAAGQEARAAYIAARRALLALLPKVPRG